MGFYLSEDEGNQFKYIFNSNEDEFNENRRLPEEEHLVKELLRDHYDEGLKQKERDLLVMMAGPDAGPDHRPLNLDSIGKIFEKMYGDKHQKRILGYIARGPEGWNSYENASAGDVMRFLRKYETPIDFEKSSNELLAKVRASQTEGKYQEYCDAMEKFQLGVYGKKYEYYKAMRELLKEAREENDYNAEFRPADKERLNPRSVEILERDPNVKDAGLATLNKGYLTGNPNRVNEDAVYYNPEMGLFGVFDGAGGERGAALASSLARDTMINIVGEDAPETVYELGQILTEANRAVTGVGYTTAAIGRVLEKDGRKALLWASVGDSRIYVVRNGLKEAIQLTRDEGSGNIIEHALGYRFKVDQFGEYPLQDGDRVVFCSDGVTGDYEQDFIPNNEFAKIVGKAATADLAAWSLVNRGTKIDDRSAIVAEV